MRSTNESFSGVSRKEKRRKKKILKKFSKVAFSTHRKLEDVVQEHFGTKKKRKRSKKKKSKKSPNEETANKINHENSLNNFNEEAEKLRQQRFKDQIKEDNTEIRKMEKLLGYKKHKSNNLPRIFYAEGLDYLLEMCDKEKRAKFAQEDDDDVHKNEDGDLMDKSEDENSVDLEEETGSEMEEDDDSEDEIIENDPDVSTENEEAEIKEDIYGRKIDSKTGKVVENLNLSSAKAKLESLESSKETQEKRLQLEKSIRGVINRLNENTLSGSVKVISEIFSSNSHNEVKQIYADMFFKAIATTFALPERLLLTYGAFMALTHVTVSPEITAHLVESYTTKFFELMQDDKEDEKPVANLIVLFAHLYNFKVVKTQFMIELISRLSKVKSEKFLSMFLALIKYAGTSLKKRDAKKLQESISSLQEIFSCLKREKDTSSRMNFLLEDLDEIKNNHILRLTSKFDHSNLDHFYKLIKALTKNAQNKESELPFGVEDVMNVNERGRWWVVGSAWKPADEKQTSITKQSSSDKSFSPELLALAKRAKMNTELRRNVFCSILSSEDEDDAFQKLQKFSLKGPQEREIIHICIMSSLFEKEYNQFYASLVDRFCTYHKRFQLTTQYALWDRIKDIANLKPNQQSNLANIIADLIKLKSVGITVLKIMNFAATDEPSLLLLQRIFYRLCIRCSDSLLTEIFRKPLSSSKNELLAQGLQMFFEVLMKPEDFEEMDDYSLFKKRLAHVKSLCAV